MGDGDAVRVAGDDEGAGGGSDLSSDGSAAGGEASGNAPFWCLHWSEAGAFDVNAYDLGVNIADLMEAAGQAVSGRAMGMLGEMERPTGPVWILCGGGNNGGDGFAAALGLVEDGVDVRLLASDFVQKSDAGQLYRDQCVTASLPISIWPDISVMKGTGTPALVIDCLLGAGMRGPVTRLRDDIAEIRNWLAESRGKQSPVLACDIPTALGSVDVIAATETVTFDAEKWHMRDANDKFVGEVGTVRIAPLPWPETTSDCGRGDILRYPPLDENARKGERGRVLVIGGGPYHGAPLLAGSAAERSGCDLVHVAMPRQASQRAEWPLSIIPEKLPDAAVLTEQSHETIMDRVLAGRGCQAVLIGPGLGRESETMDAVRRLLNALAEEKIPVVIDADAIRALPSRQWPSGLIGVATPHEKELENWIGGEDPTLILAMRAEREGIVNGREDESVCIVRTGATDSLWAPAGRFCRARGGHPRMSVGGTGDLLSGLIAGLIAQGMSPWSASRLGCAVMREAGMRAGAEFGPGLAAVDVPPFIARTLADWIS